MTETADCVAPESTSVTAVRDEVRNSLQQSPPWLSSRFFYDAEGARLFEQICTLPEYYPTRCELEILQEHLPEVARRLGPGCEIIEPGSGEGIKTRRLLEALDQPAIYRPIDVARDQLLQASAGLRAAFPQLAVEPMHGDFTGAIPFPAVAGRRVFYFPGSTIGNFPREQAQALLARWRQHAGTDGALLIGVDLRKDPQRLHAAYNDASGLTAAFNQNILRHLNRVIGSDFVPERWAHEAPYDEASGQVQMWLRAQDEQRVDLGDGSVLRFADGDRIRTEYSCKYSVPEFQELGRAAGWQPEAVWQDRRGWFSVQLLRAR